MGHLATMARVAEQNPKDVVVESTDTSSPMESVESQGRMGTGRCWDGFQEKRTLEVGL